MSMDYPPPPGPPRPPPGPPGPPDPSAPPAYPLPTSNVQPVAPPIPYQPPPPPAYQPAYQPAPAPAPYYAQQQPYYAYRLPKNKTTAVLLAIFVGFVAWMYTYEKDAWKFWTAFAITVADAILSTATFGIWLFVAIPVALGIWIWGIIDVAAKSQQFYDLYPAA